MTDRLNKILLAVVLLSIITGLTFFAFAKRNTDIQTAKQAIVAAQTNTEQARNNYNKTKERNIQNEKTVAKNTVERLYCEQYSTDADILIGFAELVQRAKEYNARQLNNGAGISTRP